MKTTLAWRNVVDNRARAVITVGSVCFAILLIYMQLGFYETTRRSSTLIYDQLEFDAVLLSPHYVHLRFAGDFPKQRLAQAEAVDGVSRAIPLYVGNGDYRSRADGSPQEAMVLGVDPVTRPFRLPDAQALAPKLAQTGTAIMDRTTTSRTFGPIEPNTQIEFNNRQLDLLSEVARKMRHERHSAGTSVVEQGTTGDRSYIVHSGKLEVLVDGQPVTQLGSQDYFGEAALIREQPRNATVRCLEDSELYSLNKTDFLRPWRCPARFNSRFATACLVGRNVWSIHDVGRHLFSTRPIVASLTRSRRRLWFGRRRVLQPTIACGFARKLVAEISATPLSP